MSNIVQNLLLTSQKVERALMLWATGTITIEAVKASQSSSKAIALKPLLNKLTGKMSTTAPSFNEANWGSTTRASAKSVRQPKPEHFMEIMKIAMSFADATTKPNLEPSEHQQGIITDADSNDIRANLVNLCDDESGEGSSTECK